MTRFFIYLLFLFVAVSAVAQVNVSGTVVDKESNEPLTGASVIVKGADGKIKKFTTSKGDGGFAMSLPSVAGCRLEVSMMGFAKKTILLDSVSFPLTVYLEPGITLLKEVTVKADRIREQGDTITYNVGSFAQQQDRSIGDVLRRMPGINVEQSGKIQYQGEDINKFYIEGAIALTPWHSNFMVTMWSIPMPMQKATDRCLWQAETSAKLSTSCEVAQTSTVHSVAMNRN